MKIWATKSGYKITQVLAGRSNVFLLANNEKNILIDTSPGSRWKNLDRCLRRMGIDRIDVLILTHTHYDHVGNASRLKNKYKAKVIVHHLEAPYLAKGKGIIPQGTNMFTKFLVNHLARMLGPKADYEPCQADVSVAAIYELSGLGFPHVQIIPTPGHTAGSQSIIVDEEIALVGDAMFGVFPWSAFPPFAGDARQMVESWGKLLATNCRLFLPAHGTADSRELVQKDYNKRNRLTESISPH
jgi:hydroxyacylglutathione hydrolase